jgi:uncharacterized protein (TIGR02597 family)
MKPITSFALLAAIAATIGAANAAATDPVGYITVNIAGPGDTYISPSLVEATTFAGATTATPSGGSVATFASGVPTGLDGTYVLEITSGASEGWWSTVTASTDTTVTVADAFPAGLPANTTISVRKHSTLRTFLGLNSPNLSNFNGVDPSDEVQVLNPSTQVVTTYAWVTAADLGQPEGAWFNLASSETANDTIIEPGSSIKIKRLGGALSFTTSGAVKVTKTQVDLYPNFNWVGTPLATGSTLNGMTFNSQLNQFDGISPNYDELQILRPNQVIVPFAAVDDGAGGTTMFNLADSSDAGAEPFVEGTGAIIKRIGNPASTITIPATTVAP